MTRKITYENGGVGKSTSKNVKNGVRYSWSKIQNGTKQQKYTSAKIKGEMAKNRENSEKYAKSQKTEDVT